MDPVTALSLACGVIQVVDFSIKTLHKSKELWEKGSLGSHDDLEDMTKRLGDLQIDLTPPQTQQTAFGSVSHQFEDELLQLVDKIKKTSNELLEELQILKPKRKRDTVQAVVATMARKKKLDELKDKLDSYRRVLDTKVIIGLRGQLHHILHQQQEDVKKLDQSLQTLIASFAAKSSSFDGLVPLLREESRSIREHVTSQINQMEKRAADTKFYEELLASLRFPEIHCREEEIRDPYTETFCWIFNEANDQTRPQPSFVEWLKTGSKIFWVRGKAGSGKSTLMKYIWQHSETQAHLKTWAEPAKLIIPAYFFWTSGSSLQKTLVGLLRSLIYQILHNKPEFVAHVKQATHPMGLPFLFGQTRDEIPNWTESRLQHCLVLLTENIPTDCRICIFIDGLDEFSGDHWAFVGFLVKLVENSAIKCCVSSRPEKPYDDLGFCAIVLKLEDYTRPDIKKYVRGKFSEIPRRRRSQITENEIERIVKEISRLADGVFLWVELVVNSQITMIRNDDDFDLLWSHLEHLPREVEGLYNRMLEKIDSAYQGEAAKYLRYLQTIEHGNANLETVTVLDLAIAVFGLTEEMELKSLPLDPQLMRSKSERVKERIRSTCSGILEIHEGESSRLDPEEEVIYPYKALRVQFHHRRAKDFFMKGKPGCQFLDRNSQAPVNQQVLPVAVRLGETALKVPSISEDLVWKRVHHLFKVMSTIIERGDRVPISYLEYIDKTLGKLALFWFTAKNESHWVAYFARHTTPRLKRYLLYDGERATMFAPLDFLSFAASWHFHDYVSDALRNRYIPPSPETLNNLLFCALIQYQRNGRCGYRFSIESNQQLQLVTYLVKCGTDMQSDMGVLIWTVVLESLAESLLSVWPSDDDREKSARMIQTFLEAGACRDPIISLSNKYNPSGRFGASQAWFLIDTHVVPISEWIKGRGSFSESRDHRKTESSLIDYRALRIWFYNSLDGKWFPAKGFDLLQDQARELHRCVRAQIEAEDYQTRMIADRRLNDHLGELYQIYASPESPIFTKGSFNRISASTGSMTIQRKPTNWTYYEVPHTKPHDSTSLSQEMFTATELGLTSHKP